MTRSIFNRGLLIWLLAAGFFFSEYFARVAPSVMAPELMHDFGVDAFGLGAFSAFFYYAYVGMQLPVGALIDHFGPHKLLTAMATLCGLSCLVFGDTSNLNLATTARFMMGLSAAFAFVGALKLAKTWFPASQFGLFAGATQALGMLGAAIGEGPVSVLVKNNGWRNSMFFIGAILIILAILIALFVRDAPTEIPQYNSKTTSHPLWWSLIEVLKRPQSWVNGFFVGFLYAPTAAFAELWGPSYLHAIYKIPSTEAAGMISMIFIGFALSSPLAGWLSDRIKKRKPIILCSIVLSFILMSSILYFPHLKTSTVALLLFLYGMSNVAVATSYAVASEIVPSPIAATSMAFANMASVIIGALFQPIIGYFLELNWGHVIAHGIHVYSAQDYRVAMLILPACTIISLIAWCFLKESYHAT